jgi:tetratricopeptide (TPR) repeat protein
VTTQVDPTKTQSGLPSRCVMRASFVLLLALALSACQTRPASNQHSTPTPADTEVVAVPPPAPRPAAPDPKKTAPAPVADDRPIPEPTVVEPPVSVPAAERTVTDYDDLDKQARIEFGYLYVDIPRKPKVDASKGGIVSNEDWVAYQAALGEYLIARRAFYRDVARHGEAFLGKFPRSKYELEIARATLMALHHSGNHERAILRAEEFLRRYGDIIAEVCFRIRGDSSAALENYDAAAAAYADYHAHASERKKPVSAIKWVNALMQAGRADEAIRVGRGIQTSEPRAAARIEDLLSRTALIGHPLPATPGARKLLSEEGVDWAALEGKVTLVLIWSTQFASCDPAIEEVGKLATRLRGRPFQVVGVVLEEKSLDSEIEAWLRAREIPDFVQVVQRGRFSKSEILNRWGLADEEASKSTAFPETIILDKEGTVRHVHIPVGKHLEKLITEML